MTKRHITRKRVLVSLLIILLALASVAAGVILLDQQAAAPPAVSKSPKITPKTTEQSSTTATTFDKSRYSTTDPSSLWVVVNKQHPFSPVTYTPSDLVTAYGHQVSGRLVIDLTAMIDDGAHDGAFITLVSSYRSYSYQVGLYTSYVASDGQAKADTYSARAGYSEHQSGLAIDFGNKAGTCSVQDCYADTAEGKWLEANAYKYGFLLRYTAAKQSVTGYQAEAWHYRYIGRDLSTEMHSKGISTLEEFFGITGGETYN